MGCVAMFISLAEYPWYLTLQEISSLQRHFLGIDLGCISLFA
ncbi:hypothetical protein yfred0001_30030 [Yersinia frederiksenii ATCC 33641]|nr:hypothetical protein yfred0001_30030 [Yersinia frederiksenii ATCC 33641]